MSAVRSAVRIEGSGPATSPITSPGRRSRPVGQAASRPDAGVDWAKASSAHSRPATTPSPARHQLGAGSAPVGHEAGGQVAERSRGPRPGRGPPRRARRRGAGRLVVDGVAWPPANGHRSRAASVHEPAPHSGRGSGNSRRAWAPRVSRRAVAARQETPAPPRTRLRSSPRARSSARSVGRGRARRRPRRRRRPGTRPTAARRRRRSSPAAVAPAAWPGRRRARAQPRPCPRPRRAHGSGEPGWTRRRARRRHHRRPARPTRPPDQDRGHGAGRRRRVLPASIASTSRAPNTMPSSSELDARRLAPCTPVHAVSPPPTARAERVAPSRSVITPPER